MNYKNLIYAITCLSFSVIIGAAIYEHMAVVPEWSAAPPKSLSMFQGEYGLNAGSFWQMIHPVTGVWFVLTLISSWKSKARPHVLIAFVGYIIIIAITAIYFVPELIAITTTPYSEEVNRDLTQRAGTWETLSLVRLMVLILLSIVLFLGLTKKVEKL